MRYPLFTRLTLIAALACGAGTAWAQAWNLLNQTIALKSGESTEIADIYWVINCQSQLVAPPEVTVLEGPPGVTASITEAMVSARFQQCPKPVKGAKLHISAHHIDEPSTSIMTLRIRYKTKDGDRDRSMNLTISLFP